MHIAPNMELQLNHANRSISTRSIARQAWGGCHWPRVANRHCPHCAPLGVRDWLWAVPASDPPSHPRAAWCRQPTDEPALDLDLQLQEKNDFHSQVDCRKGESCTSCRLAQKGGLMVVLTDNFWASTNTCGWQPKTQAGGHLLSSLQYTNTT